MLSDDDKVPLYIDMWKQTVGVQQHFNDIEWRIRGLALTALTFAFGVAAVAAKDKTGIDIVWWTMPLSAAILYLGLVLWGAFYFVDQIWYHRLLIGAVIHGTELEVELRRLGLDQSGLTHQISASSPHQVRTGIGTGAHWYSRPFKRRDILPPIRSAWKMKIFYAIGALTLLVPAVGLQLGG